jgi:allophanate hydrolase subunit 2
MVDANTAGGYPKIGKIIEADLSILGQVPIGKSVRFKTCSVQDAIDVRDAQHLRTRKIHDLMAALRSRP